jgi:uncharacterized protein (TIGR02147 family)
MALSTVDIFQYTDFRSWLKDVFQQLKDRDPKFSHRFILQRLSVKSSGWLADMISGRRILNRSHLLGLSRILGLGPREELYFETLADYNQAKNLLEKNRAYEKLLTFHEIPKDIIDVDRFEYFSKWYYSVVREYLLIEPFRGDYTRLGRRIRPAISTVQARESIELLERLGFIKRLASGEFRPCAEHVKKQNNFSPVHYYQYMKTQMELGMGAMERLPKEERDISALSVTLSHDSFQIICEEIKALRQKMIQISETENKKFWNGIQGDTRRVFQGVFELFPVTTTRTSSEEGK